MHSDKGINNQIYQNGVVNLITHYHLEDWWCDWKQQYLGYRYNAIDGPKRTHYYRNYTRKTKFGKYYRSVSVSGETITPYIRLYYRINNKSN